MSAKQFVIWIVPVLLIAATAALEFTEAFQTLEYTVYDAWLHVKPAVKEREEILFLDVDDLAINKIGVWPWSRDIMATGLLTLREFDAAYSVFDIEYTEESPLAVNSSVLQQQIPASFSNEFNQLSEGITGLFGAIAQGQLSPEDAADFLPDLTGMAQDAENRLLSEVQEIVRDNDTYMGRAAETNGTAFYTVTMLEEPDPEVDDDLIAFASKDRALQNVTVHPAMDLDPAPAIRPAIRPILSGAAGAGFPNVVIDEDGVRRRIELVRAYEDAVYGQLAFRPLLHWMGDPPIEIREGAIILSDAVPPGETNPRTIRIPLAEDGTMYINWPKKTFIDSFRHLSYYELVYHEQLWDDLEYNLRAMDESGYLQYHEGDRNFMDGFNHVASLRTRALEDTDGSAIDERGDVRSYLVEQAGVFLDGRAEATLMAELNAALGDPSLSEDMVAYLTELQADIPEVFASTSSIYQALVETRSILQEEITGSFILIGYTGTSTTDIGVNPFEKEYMNTGTHGALVNTILTGTYIDDLPWWISLLISVAFTAIFVVLSAKREPSTVLALGLGATAVVIVLSAGLFVGLRLFLPIATPVTTLILATLSHAVFKYVEVGKEKSYLRHAFNHYLSTDVINQILDDPSKLQLGGEKRELTCMFTDVKGFSTISESLDPQELVKLLNRYLSEMSDIVLQLRGTIDKYEGDAIISFFGAPVTLDDHASRAFRAAIRMKKIENFLNEHFEREKLSPQPLKTRIGINTGDVVVGNMGTVNRMDYTVMGHPVNLASRLEGVNKQYGTWILASEMSWQNSRDEFAVRKLDRVRVVGISEPVRLYEVVDERELLEEEKRQLIDEFENGLELFEGREFGEAGAIFGRLSREFPEDGPATTYFERTNKFQKEPPPANWDGVFNLTRK